MGKSQFWHRIQSHLFTVKSRRLMVKSTMFAGELPMGFPGPRQDLTAELKNLDPDVQAAEGLSEGVVRWKSRRGSTRNVVKPIVIMGNYNR